MTEKPFPKKTMEVLIQLIRDWPGKWQSAAVISKRTSQKVTKQWTLKVLKALEAKGWIDKKMTFPRKHMPVQGFRLRSSQEVFTEVARRYLFTLMKNEPTGWQKMAIYTIMAFDYLRSNIKLDFVVMMFAQKKVKLRYLALSDGNEKLSNNDRETVAVDIAFEKDKTIRVRRAKHPGSEKTELSNDLVLKIEEKIKDTIIVPIWAMLSISPSALYRFIGNWKPYRSEDISYSSSNLTQSIDHILFRMVWDTVNDISFTRDVPSMSEINYATVGGTEREDHPTLRIMTSSGRMIRYYVEFSTMHDYYGSEDSADVYEIEMNPENVSVRISVTDERRSIK